MSRVRFHLEAQSRAEVDRVEALSVAIKGQKSGQTDGFGALPHRGEPHLEFEEKAAPFLLDKRDQGEVLGDGDLNGQSFGCLVVHQEGLVHPGHRDEHGFFQATAVSQRRRLIWRRH